MLAQSLQRNTVPGPGDAVLNATYLPPGSQHTAPSRSIVHMSNHTALLNMSLNKGCIQIRYNETEHLPWDHPDNIVSQQVANYVTKIKNIILAFSFLIGGPANVINMAVFYKQGLQDRVNLCLFLLAFFDELYLVSTMFYYAENIYMHISGQEVKSPANVFMTNNNLSIFVASAFVSGILTAIIACERCYCVLRPLKYQTMMRTRTMAVIITLLSVCVYGLHFIVSYQYWIHCVYDPVTNTVSMMVTGGGFYWTHRSLVRYLESIVFGFVVSGGVMFLVITSTIITAMKLRQVATWRSEASSLLTAKEVALTKMLIGNTVFYIICTLPTFVFRCICLMLPEVRSGGRHHNFYLSMLRILVTFYFFNSSFNIFIYYVMGSRYRETFWALFNR
ncbi:uncharacterized protein LOC143283866 [Babylonia areolata]|uniref:uncharacterized protein LOC143283866 n=1 Tax=Babylonia areolata TaxID=304850 RepID=UPI003FD316DB